MVDQMETLQSLYAQSEARRAETDARIQDLIKAVGGLTDRMGFGQVEAVEKLTAAQERLAQAVEDGHASGGLDEESRARLRSMDVQLYNIAEALTREEAPRRDEWGVEADRGAPGRHRDADRRAPRAHPRRRGPGPAPCRRPAHAPPGSAAQHGGVGADGLPSAARGPGSPVRSGRVSWMRSPRS
jgi:hypothetical protein